MKGRTYRREPSSESQGCNVLTRTTSIAEMAEGWGNKIMRDEPSFIVLEGL